MFERKQKILKKGKEKLYENTMVEKIIIGKNVKENQ